MNEAQALHPKNAEKYQIDKNHLLPAFAIDPKKVTTTATSANGSMTSLELLVTHSDFIAGAQLLTGSKRSDTPAGINGLHQGVEKKNWFENINKDLSKSFLQKSIDEAERDAKDKKIAALANLKGKPINIINTSSGDKGDLATADNEL